MSAPPWRDEPSPALWHFSEEPAIRRFVPRSSERLKGRSLVWAVDTRHSPLFWFPRQCPRITFWTGPTTTLTDRERFFGSASAVGRIHAVEEGWLASVGACRLFAYRLPGSSFVPEPSAAGYWVSPETVRPLEVEAVGDLVARHSRAEIELRSEISLWPTWHRVIRSSLGFSGARLSNSSSPQPPDLLP